MKQEPITVQAHLLTSFSESCRLFLLSHCGLQVSLSEESFLLAEVKVTQTFSRLARGSV